MIRNVHLLFDETLTRRSRSNPRIISEGIFERERQSKNFDRTHAFIRKMVWFIVTNRINIRIIKWERNDREREERRRKKKTTAKEEKKKKKKIVLQSNRCMHIAWFKFSSSLPSLLFFFFFEWTSFRSIRWFFSHWHRNNYTNLILK